MATNHLPKRPYQRIFYYYYYIIKAQTLTKVGQPALKQVQAKAFGCSLVQQDSNVGRFSQGLGKSLGIVQAVNSVSVQPTVQSNKEPNIYKQQPITKEHVSLSKPKDTEKHPIYSKPKPDSKKEENFPTTKPLLHDLPAIQESPETGRQQPKWMDNHPAQTNKSRQQPASSRDLGGDNAQSKQAAIDPVKLELSLQDRRLQEMMKLYEQINTPSVKASQDGLQVEKIVHDVVKPLYQPQEKGFIRGRDNGQAQPYKNLIKNPDQEPVKVQQSGIQPMQMGNHLRGAIRNPYSRQQEIKQENKNEQVLQTEPDQKLIENSNKAKERTSHNIKASTNTLPQGGTRLKGISFSKNFTRDSNLLKEEILVNRISDEITSTTKQTPKKLNPKSITKVQAHIRRRRQQKIYKQLLKKSRYRAAIFNELLKTEELYVEDLRLIVQKVIAGLKKNGLLTDQEIQSCFANIQAILTLNETLLSSLQEHKWHPNKQVVSIIQQYAPYFKIYFEYLNNYQNMTTLIEKFKKEKPKFNKYIIEIQQGAEFRRLYFDSFIVKPVQRLPKYVLLLKDYLKHTDESHVDYKNIQKALESFNQVTEQNNLHMNRIMNNAKQFELQKAFGDQEQIQIIDPKRDFLFEEPMTSLWRGNPKSVIVYFFSDLVLIVERILSEKSDKQLRYLTRINLSETSKCVILENYQSFQYIFNVIGDNGSIIFIAEYDKVLNSLMEKINKVIDSLKEKEDKRQAVLKKMQVGGQPMVSRNKWKIDVLVKGTEERSEMLKHYTVYIIEILIESIVSKVFLRYSEYMELQEQTKKLFPRLNIPYNNDKNLLQKHDSKFIESRKLQIQTFLQTVLGQPEFYEQTLEQKQKDVQSILKYIGLPKNFYELPGMLVQYDKSHSPDKFSIIHKQRQNYNSLVEAQDEQLNMDLLQQNTDYGNRISLKFQKKFSAGQHILPKPEEINKNQEVQIKLKTDNPIEQKRPARSTSKDTNRPLSSAKLLQNTFSKKAGSEQKVQHQLQVKLCNQNVEVQINDETLAITVLEDVAKIVKLKQFYDFKLFDEKSGRIVQDDEILLNIFQKKEQDGKAMNIILQKVKSTLQAKFSIHYRKMLYLPKYIELQEYLEDPQRLKLIIAQLVQDVVQYSRLIFSFKEYCTIAALLTYINQIETGKTNIIITFELMQQFLPQAIRKATDSKIWVKQAQETLITFINSISEEISQINEKVLQTSAQIRLAQRVLLHIAQQNKQYGQTLFQIENEPENKFSKKVPVKILLGVSIEGLSVLDASDKTNIIQIPMNDIETIKTQHNHLIIETIEDELGDRKIFKFHTTQEYHINQLYQEYQDILMEIEKAQEEQRETQANGNE